MTYMHKQVLSSELLIRSAIEFCIEQSGIEHPELLGVTDGKAVGTYVEHKFKQFINEKFIVSIGNSASGIDLPDAHIDTDIKVTSIRQPQSSCPYKSSRQKIFGLGYNLLVFVYDKNDIDGRSLLHFINCTYIRKDKTADYTTTKRIFEIIQDGGTKEDLIAYFEDRNIPGDEITYDQLADEVLSNGIHIGYLTISNALQWRLQYGRVIGLKNEVEGIQNHDFSR